VTELLGSAELERTRKGIERILASTPQMPMAVTDMTPNEYALFEQLTRCLGMVQYLGHRLSALAGLDFWLPMEEAPKDGTDILLYAPAVEYRGKPTEERITIGHWMTDEECRLLVGDCGGECRCPEYDYVEPSWISWDGGFTDEHPPTRFMYLPKGPSA
jgi:hypothetical protein